MGLKLKSLELQGYKTFARKTRFEFPAPITAIVGPNGSGKSNIADAIRWVLGEQSYTVLRGRKTMDMIFTGSDQKARSSMASVSILFDNQEEWLPIDYEEVEITRRAYRSGENEYQVNGQRVRLKDINELLGQSGLSERTYTIIGQGLIDSALSLKPDDRRRFFEEAAGIGLFRSRREEAINRLEITQHNLERINDILGELEPRLKSLQRQSKRAAEYEQLKKDLTVLLKDWYGYHWHKTQQSLVEAMELCESQEAKTKQIQQEYAVIEQDIAAVQEEIRGKRILLGELHDQLSKYHHAMDESSRESSVLDERLNAARRQIAAYREESELIEAEITLLIERREKVIAESAELKKAGAIAFEQKTQLEAELAAKQKELSALQNKRNESRSLLTKTETTLIQLKARRDEAQNRLDALAESYSALQTALVESETILAELQKKQTKIQNDLKAIESDSLKSEQEQNEIRNKLRDLEEKKAGLSDKLNQNQAQLTRYKAQYEVLNQAEKNLTGLNQGAQFLLKNIGKVIDEKEFRSLGSCFIFPKEVEIAAAAVLGEYLDAILLNRDKWEKAADLLSSGNNGRAVFISEKDNAKDTAPVSDSKIAAQKSLADLAICDPEYKTLAERLFRKAYLADSFKQASELQPLLQAGESLVTPEGDLFRANGSMATGKEPKYQLISRKREMKELRELIEDRTEVIQTVRDELNEINQNIQTVQKQAELTAERHRNQSRELEALRKSFNQAVIETQKREQLIAFQKQRIQENEQQSLTLKAKKESDDAKISELEAELSGLRETVKKLSDAVHQIQLDDLQQQVHHRTLEWTVNEKSIHEAETQIAELTAQIEKNQQRSAQNLEKKTALEQQILSVQEQIESLKSNNTLSGMNAAEIEAKIAPEENALKSLQQRLETLQSELQIKQAKTSAAEKQLLQQQMEVTRLNDQLDTLKQRIEDDFGLVAFDYKEKVAGQTPLPLGDMVSELPKVEELPENIKDQISRQKGLINRIGAINPDAIEEYESVNERYNFLLTQSNDLKSADRDLREVIGELDEMMKKAFQETFEKVQAEFKNMFTRLFGGGEARLVLTDPDNINQSGIEIEAKLPGRREQELSLLSGGERSLTSVALVFALLRVSPTPFCVLDEVDAALDESNVGRFCELLKDLSRETQFIVITHNRNTVETADVIYGITMGKESSSQVVSLRLDEINKDYLI